ncbi:MAG: DUF3784 domain-containing protein [Clostridiales bacterium]|jgi:hypothetical protein|nr:DUF3784 domain-containing protein [Clostridiales bacterium]
MAGRIIGALIMAAVGALLVYLGILVRNKEKITLLNEYHRDKVAPENRRAFCRLSGSGLILMGAALAVTAALFGATESPCSFICFAAGFSVGLGMLVTAGRRYNR